MKIQIKIETFSTGSTSFYINNLIIKIRKYTKNRVYFSSVEPTSLYQIWMKEFDPKFIRKIAPTLSEAIKANEKLHKIAKEHNENKFSESGTGWFW